MACLHLLWFLLSADAANSVEKTLATADIVEAGQVQFTLQPAPVEHEAASMNGFASEQGSSLPQASQDPPAVTAYLPNLLMVNGVRVSIGSADAPKLSEEIIGGAAAVIAQFN